MMKFGAIWYLRPLFLVVLVVVVIGGDCRHDSVGDSASPVALNPPDRIVPDLVQFWNLVQFDKFGTIRGSGGLVMDRMTSRGDRTGLALILRREQPRGNALDREFKTISPAKNLVQFSCN